MAARAPAPQPMPIGGSPAACAHGAPRARTAAEADRSRGYYGSAAAIFYRSFVFVQYQRMLGDGGEIPAYRPTHDKAYEREVERMRLFQKESADRIGPDPVQDYRLHPGAFYFKVCPEIQFDPLSPDLREGQRATALDTWGRGTLIGVVASAPGARGLADRSAAR